MSSLFSAFNLAGRTLRNRIVMAPMTRSRAPDDVADVTTALYYAQRATAGLIVSEGTPISREGQGYLFTPGIFTPEQVAGWRLTTQSVRAAGGCIFAQIWHVGRMSHASIQENGAAPVSGTSKVAEESMAYGYDAEGEPAFLQVDKPRALETNEVARVVEDFAQASANAVDAGFDGVEIHAANGYLFEQFLNPHVNDRDDHYAADTIDNRLRFVLEVVDAIIARIGKARVGIRLSPYGLIFDMPHYDAIDETYAALVEALGQRGIAYVHLMDQSGWVSGDGKDEGVANRFGALLRRFRPLLPQTALVLAGGMSKSRAEELLDQGDVDLVGFGQPFISNPDLVERLRTDLPLTSPDRATYYGGGVEGYVDYPPFTAPIE